LAFFADASGENPNCMSIITDEDWSLLSLIMMPLRSIVVLQGEKKLATYATLLNLLELESALFSLLKFLTFSPPLFPSHHIKCTKSHMFRAVNVGKKLLITQF
jgi:hypothetical protein